MCSNSDSTFKELSFLVEICEIQLWGGGVATQKNRTLPQISNLGLVFFGFSILANFDWFNGFLLSGSFCL